jgi:hypothetical protein
MAYLLAAIAASGIFVVAGRRSRRALNLASAPGRQTLPFDPLWGEPEIDAASSQSQADVAGAIRLALKRLGPVMASKSVQAEVAAAPGLLVRMRGAALADLLEELVASAIHNAPASRLLLTAARYGDRIYVGVTDDMPGGDATLRISTIRGLMERVAMRGGSLDIDVRPAEGTTMTLRLATALAGEKKGKALPEPAKAAASPLIPSMGSVSFDRNH